MNLSQADGLAGIATSQPLAGIIAAFHREVRPILRQASRVSQPTPRTVRSGRVEQKDGPRLDPKLHHRMLGDKAVIVAVAGAGAQNSFRMAQHLLANFPLTGLITIGFAGGLSSGLKIGEVVVADRVIDAASGKSFDCDTELLTVRSSRHGSLLSVEEVVTRSEQKRRLGEQWQAVAVDMESAGVARAATQAGLPFCAIKAITDPAEQSLSIDFSRCRREDESYSLWAIAWQSLTTPQGAKDLWRLGKSARQAAKGLAAALVLR